MCGLRRGRSRTVGAVVATACGALLVTVCWVQVTAGAPVRNAAGDHDGTGRAVVLTPRPNIVFIMVDDMRDDDVRYMPWTRRLVGDRGVRFVNSFVPLPRCCPARASVLTGLYPHNHGVYDVRPPYGFSSFDDSSTLATWLQDAGYWTGYLGKYLHEYGAAPPYGAQAGNSLHYVPPGWENWRASIDGGLPWDHPKAGSTYSFLDTTLSRNGKGLDNYEGRFQTGLYGTLAEKILQRRARSSQPFFYYLSFTAPHAGLPVEPDDPTLHPRNAGRDWFQTTARPRWTWGMFDDVIKAAPGADWADPDISDKPPFIKNDPPLNRTEKAALLELTRQRAEAMAAVDRQVRRIIGVLRETRVLERTLVVFTSDNGFFLGEQRRRQGKVLPYEPSIRVPLLMRGPGIPAGGTRHDPFMSIDFAPTLAAAAGIAPPAPVDGASMWSVARNGDKGWDRPVLTETGSMFNQVRDTDLAGGTLEKDELRDPRFMIGIRTGRYLYTDAASGMTELYDLRRDPQQYDNVARDPAYARTVTLLRTALERARACRGTECHGPLPEELRVG